MDERGRVLAFPQAPDGDRAAPPARVRRRRRGAQLRPRGRAALRLPAGAEPADPRARAARRLRAAAALDAPGRADARRRGAARPRARAAARRRRGRLRDAVGRRRARRAAWRGCGSRSPTSASADADLQEMRAAYEELHAEFAAAAGAAGAAGQRRRRARACRSRRRPTPSRRCSTSTAAATSWARRSATATLAGALAAAAGTGVLVPEYRLAPEHPFPAALDDALRAYEWMLDRGAARERIVARGRLVGRRPGAVAAARLRGRAACRCRAARC